jgi:hypothetical protein
MRYAPILQQIASEILVDGDLAQLHDAGIGLTWNHSTRSEELLAKIDQVVSSHFCIPLHLIHSRSRDALTAQARIFCYAIAHEALAMSWVCIGAYYKRRPDGVQKCVQNFRQRMIGRDVRLMAALLLQAKQLTQGVP